MTKSQTVQAQGRPPRTTRRRWRIRRTLLLIIVLVAALGAATYFIPATRWAEGSGYVMTDKEAQLRPSVEGVIARVLTGSGRQVKAGQTVIQLANDTYVMAWEEAKQELVGKQAELQRLTAAQELARQQLTHQLFQANRRLELAKDELKKMQTATSGVFSSQELQKTKLEVDIAQSRLSELEVDRDDLMARQLAVLDQDIEMAQKRASRLKAEVDLRRVRAPIAGTVNLNNFETGEMVKPEHVLGQIFDTSKWVVKLKIREQDIAFVKEGQPVEVSLSAYPAMRYGYLSAAVTRVLKVVTPQTTGDGVFYVEAALQDDGEMKYHPGMTARARIDTGKTNWLFKIAGW